MLLLPCKRGKSLLLVIIMRRNIDKTLLSWKKENNRKVLLIRGARQVGKTYSIRIFGKSFYNIIEINFEEIPEICSIFAGSLNPLEICNKLSVYFNTKIIPGKSLLFLDEIQACPPAFKSLWYFYEKMADLHVVAAGSLLDFALSEIPSFGVGRVKSLFMYPLTFEEFLLAKGNDGLVEEINSSSYQSPVSEPFHGKLLELLKIFLIIGGMPEVVNAYINDQSLLDCQILIDGLLTGFEDDFAKYKKNAPILRIQEVFNSVIQQVGSKFKYSNIAENGGKPHKEALELLIKARLAYRVYHSSAQGLPLSAQINRKKFKMLIFDTGIYQRILGMDLSDYMVSDFETIVNKGNLSELFVGLEILAHQPSQTRPILHYWHREAKSSNAEVDYVISNKGNIFPIEVKAGTKGQMQSIYLFLNERKLEQGIRISQENFSKYDRIVTVPMYAVKNVFDLK